MFQKMRELRVERHKQRAEIEVQEERSVSESQRIMRVESLNMANI